ncbi:hypothetical protein ANTRET_LOCUS2095 [Anthophora retusa]
MSHGNQNVSTIGKIFNSVTNKRSHLIKSQQKSSTKQPMIKKTALSKNRKWPNSSKAKYQHMTNILIENEIESKEKMESIDKKSYDNMNDNDPITVLGKEILDWKINEMLTSRIEERLTETPKEEHSYSNVTSGETTKRQSSPSNIFKTPRTCVDLPAVKGRGNVNLTDKLTG